MIRFLIEKLFTGTKNEMQNSSVRHWLNNNKKKNIINKWCLTLIFACKVFLIYLYNIDYIITILNI